MPPKYYCDYCDKQFHDTPASRKRHTQGSLHQRAKKAWFDSFKGSTQVVSPASAAPAVVTFGPPAGEVVNTIKESKLPPSLQPPPEGWVGQSIYLGGNRAIEGGGPRRRLMIQTEVTKRQVWNNEPLVYRKMTKRAMLITKELKKWMQEESGDGILLATLERWVASMNPIRRDWLDVLKEFDYSGSRELLFKLSEWSFNEEWFEVNKRDYAKLIERYGKAGRIEDAERLAEEMEARGFEVDMVSLTVMLGLYGKARLLERAIKVFDRIKSEGFEPDTMVYNTLMSAYGYCGLPCEAEQLLEEMDAAGVPATAETFCGLINGYARAERADEAQRVFDLILSRGIKANTKAFTALLDAYGRVGDAVKATTVFMSLRREGYVPDDRAICLLIAAYEKRELLSKAVSMVVELENVGIRPGPDSMIGLIAWFGRVGLVDEAEELFNEMVERKMRITPKLCALMCKAYVKAGRLDVARDFTEDMKSRGIKFNQTSVVNFDPAPPIPNLA